MSERYVKGVWNWWVWAYSWGGSTGGPYSYTSAVNLPGNGSRVNVSSALTKLEDSGRDINKYGMVFIREYDYYDSNGNVQTKKFFDPANNTMNDPKKAPSAQFINNGKRVIIDVRVKEQYAFSQTTFLHFSKFYRTMDSHESTYDHSRLHVQNSDTRLSENTTNQVTAQELRSHLDSATTHHTQNTDTTLGQGTSSAVTAADLRTHIDNVPKHHEPDKDSALASGTTNAVTAAQLHTHINDASIHGPTGIQGVLMQETLTTTDDSLAVTPGKIQVSLGTTIPAGASMAYVGVTLMEDFAGPPAMMRGDRLVLEGFAWETNAGGDYTGFTGVVKMTAGGTVVDDRDVFIIYMLTR